MHSRAEAAPSWLYLSGLASLRAECTLEGDEAHYLARVVRARPGEQVHATDGAGLVVTFEVLESRPQVRLRQVSSREQPLERELHLAVGAPEGERIDWLVEKAAELGATRLTPIDGERAAWSDWRVGRLERLAIAGLRQSLSCHLLRLDAPIALTEWLSALPVEGERFEAARDGVSAAAHRAPAAGMSRIVIGPSSGFSSDERKRLSQGYFSPIAFASGRLRTETAGVVAAAWWAAGDGALG